MFRKMSVGVRMIMTGLASIISNRQRTINVYGRIVRASAQLSTYRGHALVIRHW